MLRRRRRLNEARAAAWSAGEDHRFFDEEILLGVALRCHAALERARRSRDWRRLADYVAPGLLEQLRTSWMVRAPDLAPETLQKPRVRIVTVVNTRDQTAARYVVELAFEGGVSPLSGSRRGLRAKEYWTFRRDDGRWKLAAIDESTAAGHHWREPMIAEAADDPAVRSASVFELAAADAVDDNVLSSGLVAARDARTALAELALIDARFTWHVLVHGDRAGGRRVDSGGRVRDAGRIASGGVGIVLPHVAAPTRGRRSRRRTCIVRRRCSAGRCPPAC